jgi:hypothetical protein
MNYPTFEKYIERYFDSQPKFNSKSSVELNNDNENEIGIDRAYVKIELPKLPQKKIFNGYEMSYNYRPRMFYNLIKCIDIVIDSNLKISYDSDMLKMVDYIHNNNQQVNHLGHIRNNQFYYPIEINKMFLDVSSRSIFDSGFDLPPSYHGIRLCDAKCMNIKFVVTFGSLDQNVIVTHDSAFCDAPMSIYQEAVQFIKDLQLVSASMIFNCKQKKPQYKFYYSPVPLYQKITYWVHERVCRNILRDDDNRTNLDITPLEIKLNPLPKHCKYLCGVSDIIINPEPAKYCGVNITKNVIKINDAPCYDQGTSQLLSLEYADKYFPSVTEDEDCDMYDFKNDVLGYKVDILDYDDKHNLVLNLWIEENKYPNITITIDCYYKVTQMIEYNRDNTICFVDNNYNKIN